MDSVESLWSAPESVLERLNPKGQDTEWRDFLLCGLYCAVAVAFLVFFGFAAIFRDEMSYAAVIFGFAIVTCLVYGGIWFSGEYYLARHFVVVLMASLCLYLFYSGGTENSGPIYYFVFPIVAVFLQGIRLGSLSVVALLLVTLLIHETGLLGFDRDRYGFVFISRIYTVYVIISILSFLFAWFRERAERELLLSQEDLESITNADVLTGLANRSFMNRLICLEFNRFQRYGSPFCLMALKLDNFERIHRQYGTTYSNQLLAQLAQILLQNLRTMDIPARWEDDALLVMLPEATGESARLMAARLCGEVKKRLPPVGSHTLSVGISQIEDSAEHAIALAEKNLELAARGNGDSIVSGRQPLPDREHGHGLSSYFKTPD